MSSVTPGWRQKFRCFNCTTWRYLACCNRKSIWPCWFVYVRLLTATGKYAIDQFMRKSSVHSLTVRLNAPFHFPFRCFHNQMDSTSMHILVLQTLRHQKNRQNMIMFEPLEPWRHELNRIHEFNIQHLEDVVGIVWDGRHWFQACMPARSLEALGNSGRQTKFTKLTYSSEWGMHCLWETW